MPATFQCTFSKVTQKIVARKRKRGDLHHARLLSSSASSSTRVSRARAARASPGRAACRRASPAASARGAPSSASRIAGDVVRRDDDAGAGLADQLRGGAVRRDDGEDRPLGGEVLEDLPGEHAAAAAARLGDQQQQRLRVALELERAAARRRTGSARAGRRARALSAHSRSAGRKSPTKRATTSSPDSASAVRNGRGSRLPKKLPVCVIRKRSPRLVLEPVEVVEVGAVRDRHAPGRCGSSARASSAIASETATIASA